MLSRIWNLTTPVIVLVLCLFAWPAAAQTPTPPPAPAPQPVSEPVFENWTRVDLPAFVNDGLSRPYLVIVNQNDSETITNLSTAQPTTDRATLYFADPLERENRIPILSYDPTQITRFFPSPDGRAVAYLRTSGDTNLRGLWVIDLTQNISYQVLRGESLVLRGLENNPAWSPDGRRLALALETGYHLDIFVFDLAAPVAPWSGLVRDGSFNFWPSWSPDGRYVAFVSDRMTCPTWEPTQPDACTATLNAAPRGGQVHVLDTQTGIITRLSDAMTFERPYWINTRLLAFSGGDAFDLFTPSRELYLAQVPAMTAQRVTLEDAPDDIVYVRERWAADGTRVIFQNAGPVNEIVVMSASGERQGTLADVSLARFALAADWTPDGSRLAVGGTSGQCPYGVRVLNEDLRFVATGTAPRNVCNPVYAPDGTFLAYTAISNDRAALDGRRDIYVSSPDGFGATNLTIDLRGQMTMIGWVGP